MRSDSADFVPAGAHEKIAAALLRFGARTTWRPALARRVPFAWQRWWMRELARFTRPLAGVDRQAGVEGGVPGEWMRPDAAAGRATILYLHGGGYCVGSPKTHRAVTSHLAGAAGLGVFAADYRLAPEHPFPAAVEDAIASYQDLRRAGPVIIAGDSAGAGLALATAIAARQRNIDRPVALVLFSPWADLTASACPADTPDDAILRAGWLRSCAAAYLADQPATAPLASPLLHDLAGLPPTLIQAGSDELLCDQALRTHDALFAAGCEVRCEIVPNRWHAFQLLAGSLPSADAAVARAAGFIARVLDEESMSRQD
jgi:acetyl esterase/lipase